MANLILSNINKIYPNNVQAVFDFNLDIKDKEFIVFVGPSGCGKSTTLRMIAGLEEISSGDLYIDGELMNNVDPKDRNISMVFQNYALYPHMTVYGNMKFALKLRKVLKPVYDEQSINVELVNQRKEIIKKIKSLDRKFKKNQNDYEKFMGPRADLYRDLYAIQEKIESSQTQLNGIDEYTISVLENQSVKFVKEIDYDKKILEICSPNKQEEVELSKRLKEIIAKREKQLEEIKAKIDELKVKEVPLYKPRHLTALEIDIEINKVAQSIDLTRYLFRKPGALSGGQRQRVALGRAIVRKPKVFLMDEPLSNLDAKLRVQTRSEITKIHKNVGATTIYVTHDQTEAMTMADRIVVMKDGYIQQIGTPEEVYDNPSNKFVAGFIGSPAMNFLDGVVKGKKFVATTAPRVEGANYTVGVEKFEIDIPKEYSKKLKDYDGKKITLGIRPEFTYLKGDVNNSSPSKIIKCECDFVELLGFEYIVYTYICGQKIIAKAKKSSVIKEKDALDLCFDTSKIAFFDEEGKRI